MKSLIEYINEQFSNMPPYDVSVKTDGGKMPGTLSIHSKTNSDIECTLVTERGELNFIIPLTLSHKFWWEMWEARDDRWKKYGSAPIMKLNANQDELKYILIEPARKRSNFRIEPLDAKSNVLYECQFKIQDLLEELAKQLHTSVENLDEIIKK